MKSGATQNSNGKYLIFFKQMGDKRRQEVNRATQACDAVRKWKLFMCFKSWQYIRQYRDKKHEKEQKAIELLQKRRKFRIFNYLKIGVVANRMNFINQQLVNVHFYNGMRLKVLIEWCRRTQVDKSIKAKVVQMIHKSNNKQSVQFLNMSKLQLEEYYDSLLKEGYERLNSDIESLKQEKAHYKNFIKKEIQEISQKLH